MPKVKRDRAFVARDDFELDTTPTELLGTSDDFAKERGADALAARTRHNVKFLEPANHPTVFGAQVRSRVGNADRRVLSLVRDQHEADVRIRLHTRDDVTQQLDGRRDFMLAQLRLQEGHGGVDTPLVDQ